MAGSTITGLKVEQSEAGASSNFLSPLFLGDVNSEKGSSALTALGQTDGIFVFWSNYSELWRSDGTLSGTYKLANVMQTGSTPASVNYLDFLYFVATVGDTSAIGLWRTDGSVAGTVLVKQVSDQAYGHDAKIAVFSSRIFIYFGENGSRLWKSDGTSTGTVEFLNVVPNSSHRITGFFSFQNRLLISTQATGGSKLLSSDGVSVTLTLLLESSDRGGEFLGRRWYVFVVRIGKSPISNLGRLVSWSSRKFGCQKLL